MNLLRWTVIAAAIAGATAAYGQAGQYPANQFLGGPTNGSPALPKPRALVGADLPAPSASTLGGIESIASSSHSWVDSISTAGVPHQSQPGFSDLSGSIGAAQCTLFGSSSNGCVASSGGGTSNFLRADGTWSAPTPVVPVMPQGRLTLASGTPVMGPTSCGGSPCSNQGTVYYDCYGGNLVPYYNGTSDALDTVASCEVSSTFASMANSPDVFDVWWVHSGANRICIATNGSGLGWSGDTGGSVTARGTGYTQLARSRGYLTNANSITNCFNNSTQYGPVSSNQATYLGSLMTNGADQVSFTQAILGVWNYYNRAVFSGIVNDVGGAYTYTSATIREARGGTANQIKIVIGVSEDYLSASYSTWIATAAATNATSRVGVGIDSTTTFSCVPGTIFAPTSATYVLSATPPCNLIPGAGIHTISANEQSDGTNANTFQDNGESTLQAYLRM